MGKFPATSFQGEVSESETSSENDNNSDTTSFGTTRRGSVVTIVEPGLSGAVGSAAPKNPFIIKPEVVKGAGALHGGRCDKNVVQVLRVAGVGPSLVGKPLPRSFSIDAQSPTRYEHEILSILSEGKSPFLANLVAVVRYGDQDFAILEDGGKNLEKVMLEKDDRQLGVMTIYNVIIQLFHGLLYLKEHEIIHSDIKPDNLLWNEISRRLKLCDFGISRRLGDNHNSVVPYRYMPPEVLYQMLFSPATDIWSAGCVLFEITMGEALFDPRYCNVIKCKNRQFITERISKAANDIGNRLGEDARDLFIKMMAWGPESRISVEDALQHPFVKDAALYCPHISVVSSTTNVVGEDLLSSIVDQLVEKPSSKDAARFVRGRASSVGSVSAIDNEPAESWQTVEQYRSSIKQHSSVQVGLSAEGVNQASDADLESVSVSDSEEVRTLHSKRVLEEDYLTPERGVRSDSCESVAEGTTGRVGARVLYVNLNPSIEETVVPLINIGLAEGTVNGLMGSVPVVALDSLGKEGEELRFSLRLLTGNGDKHLVSVPLGA